jgi:mono/diheme cytochrome c family protein
VTEIPEHLLKRSRERRAALGLPTDGGGDDASAEAAPAAAGGASVPATTAPSSPAPAAAAGPPGRAAPPVPAAAPPPRPDPPYVAAAKERKKIPWWAMPVVGLLPLWVLLYAWALKPTEKVVKGPLGEGKTVFASCASCHGSRGAGGVGRQLNDDQVLLTFPKLEDQASLVYTGSAPYSGKVYGDPDRPGGPHLGGSLNGSFMPQQGSKYGGALTDAEIIAVVCHERFTVGGADPLDPKYAQEFADWCAPDAPKFEAVDSGESTLDQEGISTTAKV